MRHDPSILAQQRRERQERERERRAKLAQSEERQRQESQKAAEQQQIRNMLMSVQQWNYPASLQKLYSLGKIFGAF